MIKKIRNRVSFFILAIALVAPSSAYSAGAFVVKDVKVNGLQRITAGAVFNALTVKVGDRFEEDDSSVVIRELFQMGFFSDVSVDQAINTLIINVKERPAISTIDLEGNQDIDSESLLASLKDVGVAVGRVYNPFILDKVKQEMVQQYHNNGKYAATVNTTVTPLERNRVAILIKVEEGAAASIKKINIVGNKSFSDDDLLGVFELTGPTLFSLYTNSDQYSKQKLSADIERLSSYYLDRGFINFKVESTQVSISPDKNGIFVTINVKEGKVHTINEVKLAGELIVGPDRLIPFVSVQPGDIFSRRKATQTSENLSSILGHEGYSFANVNMIPEINKETATVKITFFVDPGKRVYVRRVVMEGNTKTRDEVLRREVRQMEAAPISTLDVERSKTRMKRLGHFEEVDVETPAVPGTTDQVDVKYTVKEKSSGNIAAGAGFSGSQGLVLNASISQNNFLGTGKRVSASFNNSSVNTVYSFAYTNPYYTVDGVSRGFNVSYRTTDAEEANTASYTTDTFAGGVSFGIPVNETDRLGLSLGVENTNIDLGSDIVTGQIFDLVAGNGDSYTNFKLTGSWRTDNRNRAVFATRGGSKSLSATLTLPGSDLEFFKINYNQKQYIPVSRHTTLLINGDIGYGSAYGDTTTLPFFENYYAGGKGSVRGYLDNTLGPRDSLDNVIGGSVKVVGNAEFIFPVPFAPDSKTVRLSTFVDVGNVYDDDFVVGELRYSVGVSAKWLSPFGALAVSLAAPLNSGDDDETQAFQFSFGSGI